MALLLKGHSEHINVIVRQRRMDSRSPIGSGTGQAGMAFLVGARLWRTRKDILISYLSFPMSLRFYFMSLRGHPKEAAAISPSPFVPTITRRLLRHCVPRKDILISYLSSPMSLRFYFMSLRVLPQKDAAISPSPFVPTITRRLLRRCAPRNDTVKRMSLRVLPLTGAHQKCHSRPSLSLT